MLSVSYDYWLVAASLAVALMAGFTGLSLTRGVSELSTGKRKLNIVLAAISLGGGIWSMHFVAMLGMQLPIDFFYEPLVTLISALIAILMVGVALLLLHFWPRTAVTITAGGALVGVGILAMHYLGMSGIQRCLPVYSASGVAIACVTSVGLCIGAFWVAYGQRTHLNIILGTLGFGFAVFTVHFAAMAGTGFVAVETVSNNVALIGNDTLAFVVTLGSFVICGAFLLNSVTFLPDVEIAPVAGQMPTGTVQEENSVLDETDKTPSLKPAEPEKADAVYSDQIPFEKNGKIFFISLGDVAAIRAEGHYTFLYVADERLFCPWSISEASKRLTPSSFVRAHRSYLINPGHVSEFERSKDNGICYFEGIASLDKVPVSRTHLPKVRESLGLI